MKERTTTEEVKTNQFTPGPWVSKPTASLGPQYKVYAEADTRGHDIAIVYEHDGDANARLIAAAPELLEACLLALDALADQVEGCSSDGCSEDHPCSYCDGSAKAIQDIERAIAKAEGRES